VLVHKDQYYQFQIYLKKNHQIYH